MPDYCCKCGRDPIGNPGRIAPKNGERCSEKTMAGSDATDPASLLDDRLFLMASILYADPNGLERSDDELAC